MINQLYESSQWKSNTQTLSTELLLRNNDFQSRKLKRVAHGSARVTSDHFCYSEYDMTPNFNYMNSGTILFCWFFSLMQNVSRVFQSNKNKVLGV